MQPMALVFMAGASSFVLGLTFWSFWKLMKADSSHPDGGATPPSPLTK